MDRRRRSLRGRGMGVFLDAIIDNFKNTSGIRDLEQAAEHIAANALYRIEVEKISSVTYDATTIKNLL